MVHFYKQKVSLSEGFFIYRKKTFFYVLPVAFYFPKGNIKLTSEKTDSGSLEFPRLFLLVVVQYHSIIGP